MSDLTTYPYQQIRTTAKFFDVNGVAVNPSTLSLTITQSKGGVDTVMATKVKADLQNPVTGEFYYEYTPGTAGSGTYYFNWVSTSPNTESEESVVVETPHR